MTCQKCINNFNSDLYKELIRHGPIRYIVLILLVLAIGFSVYGWMCQFNAIHGPTPYCNESFNFAIILELMFIIVFFIPLLISALFNCIFPSPKENSLTRVTLNSIQISK